MFACCLLLYDIVNDTHSIITRLKMSNTNNDENDGIVVDNALKVFVSRIPSHFSEDSVLRLTESFLGKGSVVAVNLKYTEEEEDEKEESKSKPTRDKRRGWRP